MATNVPIPNLGDSIVQGTLLRWLKNDGDSVRVDDPLIELETDKANTDIVAPVAGILRQMRKVGETIKVGEVVASIDDKATSGVSNKPAANPAPPPATQPAAATPVAPPPPAPAKQPPASAEPSSSDMEDLNPSVRPLIAEHHLDPKKIPATGPHGRLLKEDVLNYLEREGRNGKPAETAPVPAAAVAEVKPPAAMPPASAPSRAPATNALASKPGTSDKPTEVDYNAIGEARLPLSKIRKRTASNLKHAQNTAAILTTFNEVDMSSIMDLRSRLKERFEKTHGVGLGFMSFFARAVVLGLREFPRINAFIDGDDILYHKHVNLGVAVSSERGLSVPVLKNAEAMSFAKIESEIKRVANAVREGKLSLQELSGGTFTITNGGVFGSLLSTPILNPPQSAILGMHAINKRPVAINDKVEIRPMMYLALSYDHRLVDGRESVSFLVRLKEYLEDPARLMLEV